MGVGMTVEEFDEKVGRVAGGLNHVVQTPALIALRHLGCTVRAVEMRQELANAPTSADAICKPLTCASTHGHR
jgi:hypothetical protein